jgi:hypothetical protein
MLKACQDVAARHGFVVKAQDITGVDMRWGFVDMRWGFVDMRWGFDAAFRVSIPLPDGTGPDPERLRFEALAEAFGLSPADYGRQFSTGRELSRSRSSIPAATSAWFRLNASRTGRGSGSYPIKWLNLCRRG